MTPPRDIGELVDRLYTLPRSLTGNGVRQSLEVLQSFLPLQMTEYPSGASYFGWQIPREWNIRDAYVKNRQGERLIDFMGHNGGHFTRHRDSRNLSQLGLQLVYAPLVLLLAGDVSDQTGEIFLPHHLHLADGDGSNRDEHLIPGRGGQPCGPVLESLAARGFDGIVVVEVSTRRAPDRAAREADLAEALAFARLHLAPVPAASA